ncbi:hypothetical protein [Maridesulfovibrio sp.]|uniref:hypothetical protein n=1 Tax=Maridesulfovibrio sp. TaxID=2795000 RepID=UPI002AA94855|nr:hypothetical protein [Maridesulfovibrio sp.]
MAKSREITIPYGFIPRAYQIPKWNYIANGGKRAVSVWHRRAGKDLTEWNLLICEAFKRVGSYYYFFPYYKQGKKVIWNGIDGNGRPFLSYIPKALIDGKPNSTDMYIKLVNGSLIQIIGTDDIDAVVGTNPVGCIFSEYSLQDPQAWDYVSPILRENDGWAAFNYTPRGMNHGWDLFQSAMKNPNWYCERLAACHHPEFNPQGANNGLNITGVLTPEQIDEELASGRSPSLIKQEYFVDFQASSDDILIPLTLIDQAIDRPIAFKNAPAVAGLDVGLSLSGDPTALVIRKGGKIVAMEEVRLDDYDEIAGWAYRHMMEHKCFTVMVDGIGWGQGAFQALRRLYPSLSVQSVNVAEKASADDRFARLRDEIWWKVREWFEEKQNCIPSGLLLADKLRAELSNVKYDFTPSSKIKVMGKREMKKVENGGKSPNLADALGLSLYGGAAAMKQSFEQIQKNPRVCA